MIEEIKYFCPVSSAYKATSVVFCARSFDDALCSLQYASLLAVKMIIDQEGMEVIYTECLMSAVCSAMRQSPLLTEAESESISTVKIKSLIMVIKDSYFTVQETKVQDPKHELENIA